MAEKLFYTMGEVSEMFDVKPSLLRHWESQFPILQPKRNKKGNRLFSPQDVETLKLIYHLVKERGMTLEGAKRVLRQHQVAGGNDNLERDARLLEHLQHIRSLLLEVRQELKFDDNPMDFGGAEAAGGTEEDDADGEDDHHGEEIPSDDGQNGLRGVTKERTVNRTDEEATSRELFAFYEQSLF